MELSHTWYCTVQSQICTEVSQSLTFRSCHVTTKGKISPENKRKLINLLQQHKTLGIYLSVSGVSHGITYIMEYGVDFRHVYLFIDPVVNSRSQSRDQIPECDAGSEVTTYSVVS